VSRRRSTFYVGTPTVRGCPKGCTASTCATWTRRTCWCSWVASRSGHADRPRQNCHTLLLSLDQRGSHCPFGVDLPWQPPLRRTSPVRPGRIRSRRRGDKSTVVSAKYGFWTNAARVHEPAQWLGGARQQEGSWWPDWDTWLSRKGQGRGARPAPRLAFRP